MSQKRRFAQTAVNFFLGTVLGLFFACASAKLPTAELLPQPFPSTQTPPVPSKPIPQKQTPAKKKPSKPFIPRQITMVAAGDNLVHKELIREATQQDGSFDFSPYYAEVRELVHNADIAFINQETLIAGETFGYSGYPHFNGPFAIGDALVDLGFSVFNHASNHAMDKGEDAVFTMLDYWKTKSNVTILGIHGTLEARTARQIVNVKGIRIGFLAYTYGLNGMPLPVDKPWMVSLIDPEVMAREIDNLRPYCDVLAVSMHWGAEYEYIPNKQQEELAALLAAHNVDIVIGHHPHVLQPVRFFPKADGGTMVCYFSLGNFISAQNEYPRMLGGMMRIRITQRQPGTISIENAELIPLVTHYERGFKNFKVMPLDKYSHAMAERHGLSRKDAVVSPQYFSHLIQSIFGETIIPER